MADPSVAQKSRISFGYNSGTYGTEVNATNWLGLNATWTPDDSLEKIEFAHAGTATHNVEDFVNGRKIRRGVLKWQPQDFSYLTMIFGASALTGSYTHTIARHTNDKMPDHTLEVAHRRSDTNFIKTYTGACATKWSLNFSSGNPVECTADVIAQEVTKDTTLSSVTPSSVRPYMFSDVQLVLDGTTITEVINGTISLDYGITPEWYCNNTLAGAIGQPIPKMRRFSWSFDIYQTDASLFDDWKTGTTISGACTLSLIRTASTDQAVFTLSGVEYVAPPDETTKEGGILCRLQGTCTDIAPVITDSVSSYPNET